MSFLVKRIVLVACARKKLSRPAKAKELYTSQLFKLNLAYAESLKPDAVFILSARYGLLSPEQRLAPYDETLNTKSTKALAAWADDVLFQLRQVSDPGNDRFVLLAGERYRRFLVPALRNVETPFAGVPIGKQLQLLKKALTT